MKIINWNVGRPTANKAKQILEKLIELDADIVVLTETNSMIDLGSNYTQLSTEFIEQDFEVENIIKYKIGENRTTIFTKYPIVKTYETCDRYTSICADIETPLGTLTFYATIIGVFGGLKPRFHQDLLAQMLDFDKLFTNHPICIIGDYNITFSGRVYPSNSARYIMNNLLKKFKTDNLTANIQDNVDHIAITKDIIKGKTSTIETWNLDKKLSDHIGVCIILDESEA